ncbi:alanine--tRNA ligase [Ascidiimonas aurantiaca]|uniref:alanine--tRNA ligase n=1 Tax=Ascidiimonas aurantiaca TaxID=1685432 RepID=UPI0030ECCF98
MKSKEVRARFLDFFESKNHKIVPSAPMVIKDDPTLMFTNAGMNQFKEYFLNHATPQFNRVADTQKCLRVSGKHNDLEDVGIDTYHHTMFEMLGNWSFGDYFKKEAISWAWELLTEVYAIAKDRLYVTYFEGAKDEGLEMDEEAFALWKAIIPENRIIPGNKKDNFWEMGEQGPCGPSSEIHVDIRTEAERAEQSGRELVNQDHPQVVEVWNLVFMQYNRKADGSLEKLPAHHVDTGMGFERLCMVLQGVTSNYDTDIFVPLIREIETITGRSYHSEAKTDIAIRVIADHVRAVAFAVADGQLPGNSGAGYVIRRILRRAVRYGFTFLDTKEPFIFKLVDTLSNLMGEAFPELRKQKNLIVNVIREEEFSFLKTLEQGLVLLEGIVAETKGKQVNGAKAFELYDTFGFPKDLTALILREKGLTIDEKGFEAEMQKQKDRSRAATALVTDDWQELHAGNESRFTGYDTLEEKVVITKYRKVTSKKEGEMYQLVFDKTPFYPEGGGQVGDKGYLEAANGDVVYIVDTRKENNLIVHYAKNLPRHKEDTFKAVVDKKQRSRTAANHSATHLLHQALRSVLGNHVEQKGSMVHSRYLRFDFSHFTKVSDDELSQIEDFVNARIREGLQRMEQRDTPYAEAIEKGAIALFGEKYGDTVRTITFGNSTELCGGTHVSNSRDIWHFIITSETAVAAGIRRIEAITGDAAITYFDEQTNSFKAVKTALKNPKDPVNAIIQLQEENESLRKQLEAVVKEKAKNFKATLKEELKEVDGVSFLAKETDLDAASMKDLVFTLANEVPNLFIVLASKNNGKAMLTCYISKDLVASKGYDAGQVVRELGKLIQGGGGGQPFFATAGGKNPDGIPQVIQQAEQFLKS